MEIDENNIGYQVLTNAETMDKALISKLGEKQRHRERENYTSTMNTTRNEESHGHYCPLHRDIYY